MSWEEDFRRNIERTRQRIMEIAPDMLDLSAHRAARNAHAANNTPHLDGLGPSAPTQPPRRDGERAATYPQRDALLLNMSRQLCAVDDSEMPSFEEQVAETSLIVPSRTFEEEINLYAKILVEKAKYSSREVDNAIATLVKVRTKDFARHHSLSNATALACASGVGIPTGSERLPNSQSAKVARAAQRQDILSLRGHRAVRSCSSHS